MMYLVGIVAVLLLVAMGGIARQAVRDEYLLVLRWRRYDLSVWYERGEDGRYERRRPTQLPAAVARFAGEQVALAFGSLVGVLKRRGERLGHALPAAFRG